MSVGALALAGLESAKLLLKLKPTPSQKLEREFEADYAIYKLQQTLPPDHGDRNDSLFLRAGDRLFGHITKINKRASTINPDG